MKLKDGDPSLFQLYIQWLYKQDDGDDDQPRLPSQPAMRFANVTLHGLARCYVLGDRLLDDRFKDHVVDILIERFNDAQKIREPLLRQMEVPPQQQTPRDNTNNNQPAPLPKLPIPAGSDVHYIYSNTEKGSPLRFLTVRMWIRGKVSPLDLVVANPPYPEAFITDMAINLLQCSNERSSALTTFKNKELFHCKKSDRDQKRSHDDMDATQPIES